MGVLPYTPTGDEIKEVGQVMDLSPWTLDPTKEWEPLQYVFSKDGVGLAPLGDIQVVKAPQKNGKTFLLTLMMGAAMVGEYLGLKCEIPNAKVLFIDTEQHPRDTQLVYRRVCHIAGIDGHENSDRLLFMHMRGASVAVIRHAILQQTVFWKPDIIFIDGTVDCVIDPNDQSESKAYVTELSRMAMEHNCAIWNVLHVNPGSDKMRGHLGTIMAQKVSDVLMCEKKKSADGVVFEVEQTDTRHKDISKFSFIIDNCRADDGEYLAVPVAPYISETEKASLDDLMKEALKGGPLRRKELAEMLINKFGVKKSKAYYNINDAHTAGIIAFDSIMSQKYRYVGFTQPKKDEQCPF